MNFFIKKFVPAVLLIILISGILLMCSVPPVSRDALTQHLAVPKLYLHHGGIYELPGIIFSYYPELIDLIYCIPLAFGNDIIPKYIHFLFALLTAVLIYKYIKKRLGTFLALVSVLFFLSIPVIIKLSITVYVDLALIFFSTASLLSLLKWRKENFHSFWLILSAVFCGLALSTKYNGILTFFLLTCFTPFIYLNTESKARFCQIKAVLYGFVFLFVSLMVFSPWIIRDYLWTNNPVYPLYDNYFNGQAEILKSSSSSKAPINHFLVRKYVFGETWWETALIPVRIFFQGEDDNPRLFDGRLNPFLLLLPLFAFVNLKRDNNSDFDINLKIMAWFSFLFIMIAFFKEDMRIRYISPAIPPMIILSAYGLNNILNIQFSELSSKFRRSVPNCLVFLIIIFMLSLNFIYFYHLFRATDPLPYLSGETTRDQYIQHYRPEYATLEFSNKNLDKKTKLLALFLGNRRYYSDHTIVFGIDIFKKAINTSNSSDELLLKLKHHNFTDLIINYALLNEWIRNNFTRDKRILIQDFFIHKVKSLFKKGGYGLYNLK